jgi:hypothetical protein
MAGESRQRGCRGAWRARTARWKGVGEYTVGFIAWWSSWGDAKFGARSVGDAHTLGSSRVGLGGGKPLLLNNSLWLHIILAVGLGLEGLGCANHGLGGMPAVRTYRIDFCL